MSDKLKQVLVDRFIDSLRTLSDKELAELSQDHNDNVGNDLKVALKTSIAEYEQGAISHYSLLKQTEGICADFKDSLIDVNLFAEYIK